MCTGDDARQDVWTLWNFVMFLAVTPNGTELAGVVKSRVDQRTRYVFCCIFCHLESIRCGLAIAYDSSRLLHSLLNKLTAVQHNMYTLVLRMYTVIWNKSNSTGLPCK